MDLIAIKTFLSVNHSYFRFLMIALEVIALLYLGYKWKHYSHKKTVTIIEFILNLFFLDTINPFPGFTDFFWIPIYSLYFHVSSFLDLTWSQLIFYEVTTAIIGLLGFALLNLIFGRTLKFKR